MKNDLGEVELVKGTLVDVYPFNKIKAEENLDRSLTSLRNKLRECEKNPFIGAEEMSDHWKKEKCEEFGLYRDVKLEEEKLKTVRSMPDFMMATFPIIKTDINGFKKVTREWTYACLPDTKNVDSGQHESWLDVYNLAEPEKLILSASMSSWADSIEDKVCQRYGKI